jgi:hypothetical protein
MSKAKVLRLPGAARPDLPCGAEPVAPVVTLLEQMLDEARRGEIRAFAAAVVKPYSRAHHAWASGDEPTRHDLTAAIAYLQHAYIMDVIE